MTSNELKRKLLNTDLFVDCEFLDKYCKLLTDNRLLNYNSQTSNYHHAIPRLYYKNANIEIDNSDENIYILLYKDHVLAHYYLAKAALNSDFSYKMAYAVRFIIGSIKNCSEKQLLEKLPEVQLAYELIAKNFAANNPSKRPEVAKKISQARRGKIHMYKDTISIVCDPSEKQALLKDGWKPGRAGVFKSSIKGKICVIYQDKNKFIDKAELEEYLALGATIGAKGHEITSKGNMGHMSKESRERGAEKRRGRIAVHHKDTKKILYIKSTDWPQYESIGYLKGTGVISKGAEGKIWIQNGIIETYVAQEDLNNYLAKGFVKGRLKKGVVHNDS